MTQQMKLILIVLGILLYPFKSIFLAFGFFSVILVEIVKNPVIKINTKHKSQLFFLILFYLLHLIGLLYSENYVGGINDVETKMSLFLFPLTGLFFTSKFPLKEKIVPAFVFSSLLSGFIYLLISLCRIKGPLEFNELSYNKFSVWMHPTYYGVYLSVGLFCAIKITIDETLKILFYLKCFFIAVIFIFIILTQSRTAISCCILISTAFIILQNRSGYLNSIKILSAIAIPLLLFLYLLQNSTGRFSTMVNEIQSDSVEISKSVNTHPLGTRTSIWTSSFRVMKQHLPFGVGTGDVKDMLIKDYLQYDFDDGVSKNYNSHNQYLQTGIAIGIFGLFSLMAVLLIPLVSSICQKDYFTASIILIFALSFLTESFLEMEKGVILFSFCYLFFACPLKDNQAT